MKRYLKSVEAVQEFTHIATPEENSYFEAFHSILQREVIDWFIFESGYEAKITLVDYFQFYSNNKRRHRKLGFIPPIQKWNEYLNLNEKELNHFSQSLQLIVG